MPDPVANPIPNTGECDCEHEEMLCYDVVIIGGGVAGLSAAVYAARDGFRVLVLEGEILSNTEMPGGALMTTPTIENFPGFDGAGEELIEKIREQADKFGADILTARAEHIHPTREPGKLHRVATATTEYKTRSIILATGAVARNLDIHGEQEYWGRGVSTCATCDGWFYRDKTVAVIGGGDTAVEDALLLTRYAKQVYLMHRRDDLRAVGMELEQLRAAENVEFVLAAIPEEIEGNGDGVNNLKYRQAGEVKDLGLDGIFIAIGRDPATGFLKEAGIPLDPEGYILTENGGTRVLGGFPGIFAAGDAVDRVYRQAVTSAGRAVEAALETRAYLLNRNLEPLMMGNDSGLQPTAS
jgi:thioredoxin reductase (NADPH)